MSDYSVTTDFSVKDGLSTGDPEKIISGADVDVEFNAIATASATKADKVTSATDHNILMMDSNGNLEDSTIASDGAGSLTLPASATLSFEGATDDAYEATITVTDPTADRTYTFPDKSGTVAMTSDITSSFESATRMLFQQSAAPTGWTKDTTAAMDDHALRIVTTTGFTSGSVGGATAFTSVFGSGKTTGSHSLSTSEMPSHTHNLDDSEGNNLWIKDVGDSNNWLSSSASDGDTAVRLKTEATGGGGGHTHTLSIDLKYVDLIIASKD